MRITWGPTITAGLTASVAVVIFMLIIPQLLGMGAIDLTKDLGMAFSTQSPHVAGAVFLAIIGICWATVFSSTYSTLPGSTYLIKGITFGLIVGLFSLTVLPNLVSLMDTMIGAPNQYVVTPFSVDTHAMVTLVSYVLFGLTLAWNHNPTENTSSI